MDGKDVRQLDVQCRLRLRVEVVELIDIVMLFSGRYRSD